MSGGSLDTHLWGKPLHAVTWEQKLQWAVDTAEASDHLCPFLSHSTSLLDTMSSLLVCDHCLPGDARNS